MKFTDVIRMQRPGEEREREQALKRVQPEDLPPIPRGSTVVASQDSQASQVASQALPVASQEPPRLAKVNPASQDSPASQLKVASQDSQASHEQPDGPGGKWERPGRKLLAVRIPLRLYEQFDYWCAQRRVEKQRAIEQAMAAIMEGRLAIDGPASPASQLDLASRVALLMIDDTESIDIISYYARWTRNEPKQTDIDGLKELRQLPTVAAKCGILMSVLRAKGKINSLKYCVGAAREAAATPDTDLNNYLGYLEQKAKKHRAGK